MNLPQSQAWASTSSVTTEPGSQVHSVAGLSLAWSMTTNIVRAADTRPGHRCSEWNPLLAQR